VIGEVNPNPTSSIFFLDSNFNQNNSLADSHSLVYQVDSSTVTAVYQSLSLEKLLPQLAGYFAIPTTGWNWGKIHYSNAVDIASSCGTPLYAAAEGVVIKASIGWNNGYGNLIEIKHPNGVVSRYAHNQRHVVNIGQYVVQGDLIAYMGNTGNTHGPTGCHIHFEIVGAQNPFAKK